MKTLCVRWETYGTWQFGKERGDHSNATHSAAKDSIDSCNEISTKMSKATTSAGMNEECCWKSVSQEKMCVMKYSSCSSSPTNHFQWKSTKVNGATKALLFLIISVCSFGCCCCFNSSTKLLWRRQKQEMAVIFVTGGDGYSGFDCYVEIHSFLFSNNPSPSHHTHNHGNHLFTDAWLKRRGW